MDGLRRLARRQGGLFTRDQARDCGFSAYQVRRRIGTGEWWVVLEPVLAGVDVTTTTRVRDRAATLAIPGSVLAGASAARLFGMPVDDPTTYLWIGPLRGRALPGVRLLRDPLSRREVTLFDGIRCTDPHRTVVDCLRFLDDGAAARLFDRALQVGWITRPELIRRARALTGRRGAPRLVRLIRQSGEGARSEAERLAIRLLRGAGIIGWAANAPIPGTDAIGDLVFRDARLVVEIDGWAYHSEPDRFERDRQRQNRLVAAGWTVLRFTWRDLHERPAYVVATVQRMLGGPPRSRFDTPNA